jgi:hypothetical protein
MRLILLTLLLATGFQQVMAQPSIAPPLPRYVIGPPNSEKENRGLCLRELFEHPDQWAETRKITDALLYADWAFKSFNDAELKQWLAMLNGWNIKLELEVGAVKPWGMTGREAFDKQQANWERLERLGGKIYSIALDEPLSCVRQNTGKISLGTKEQPGDYAAKETANFIALVRQKYPAMLIGDIEPYPGISVEDHIKFIDALGKCLKEKNVRGLDFYRIDPNWIVYDVHNEGSWKDLKKLENYCRGIKLPFSLIYWSSADGPARRAKTHDDSTWYVGIMQQGYNYLIAGGSPDQYVLESWVSSPSHSVPESGEFTFTRSALDFGRKFVPKREQP